MRVFGLIGYPLTHSFSAAYFKQKFEAEGINDAEYKLFPLTDIAQLPALLEKETHLVGFNVTIPYKEKVIPYLQVLDAVVEEIGASNCIHIRNGMMYGYNTDVVGCRQTLEAHIMPHHHRALILGTGGAAKAVAYTLRALNIDYSFVSSQQNTRALTYAALDHAVMKSHQIIINTTPLGMFPEVDAKPAIPYRFLTEDHLLFDLIYNPAETAFMQAGKAQGATVVNGLTMLQVQAEESWKIWNT